MAVLECFTSQKICDPFLMACIRTALLICAQNNIKLVVKFIPGHNNVYADMLSRWHYYHSCNLTEVKYLAQYKWYYPRSLYAIPEIIPCVVARVLPSLCFVDNPVLEWLTQQASERAASGLRPRTCAAYARRFQLFMVYMNLQHPCLDVTVTAFFEYLILNNLAGPSLQSYLSMLNHFFCMHGWPTTVVQFTKIKLMVKSVLINNLLKPKVKGVLSVDNWKQLVSVIGSSKAQRVSKTLFLLGFFGFFRLAE